MGDIAAAVVPAGGRSSRMGRSKAALEWHGSTLLYRTSALLRRTVNGPVVVVRAPDQPLPALPAGVELVEDPVEGLGPMQGVAAGLDAVRDRAATAFVCSTDVPFLHPLADHELAANDPSQDSVVNVNTPEEYSAARARPALRIAVEWCGMHAAAGRSASASAEAAGWAPRSRFPSRFARLTGAPAGE